MGVPGVPPSSRFNFAQHVLQLNAGRAAKTGEKPVAGPANARAAVAVALAVLEAAAKGRAVPVRM